MPGQTFIEATHLDGPLFIGLKADGVLGMTLTDMTGEGITPVFTNMVDQGILGVPVFSFWLNRYLSENMQ